MKLLRLCPASLIEWGLLLSKTRRYENPRSAVNLNCLAQLTAAAKVKETVSLVNCDWLD